MEKLPSVPLPPMWSVEVLCRRAVAPWDGEDESHRLWQLMDRGTSRRSVMPLSYPGRYTHTVWHPSELFCFQIKENTDFPNSLRIKISCLVWISRILLKPSLRTIFFFIVIQVHLSPFSPHHQPPAPPIPTSHTWIYPHWLYPCVLYTCSLMTLPLLSPIIPLPSPLVTVSLFFISMSLVIICFLICFVDQVPLVGEIIWYLSFTTWLISLSIMFSRSVHATVKSRISFFLLCKGTTVFWSTHLLMGT